MKGLAYRVTRFGFLFWAVGDWTTGESSDQGRIAEVVGKQVRLELLKV